jgi:rhamnose utilization protein RhaD (predicted bifunctional aldolase and dehydrogenase)
MALNSPSDLADLRRYSARVGANLELVQGAGGNVSVKGGGVLWVKASGTWLSEAEDRDILVPLDLDRLRQAMAVRALDPTEGTALGDGRLRPSIETTLHALLPHRLVLHLHSVNAIASAVRRDGEAVLEQRLKSFDWTWVPYARPGLPLTVRVQQALEGAERLPDVLILANHGIVIGADTIDGLAAKVDAVEAALDLPVRPTPDPNKLALERAMFSHDGWRLPGDADIHAVATDRLTRDATAKGVLYPDHVVFLGTGLSERPETFEVGERIPYWAVDGAGVLVREDITPAAEVMLSCLSLVGRRLQADWPVNFLSAQDIDDLRNFDAEAYRKKLDREMSR